MRSLHLRLVAAAAGIACGLPLAAYPQSRVLRPPPRGEHVLGAWFIAPADGPVLSYVAGHAVLLRDDGGLVWKLSQLCQGARSSPDSARAAIRQVIATAEVARRRTTRKPFLFGAVAPGSYVVIAWIELHLPSTEVKGPHRVRSHFGAGTEVLDPQADTSIVLFNSGRTNFKRFEALVGPLGCLEFLVRPEPHERQVLPP